MIKNIIYDLKVARVFQWLHGSEEKHVAENARPALERIHGNETVTIAALRRRGGTLGAVITHGPSLQGRSGIYALIYTCSLHFSSILSFY